MTDTLPLREQIARLIEETKTANEKAAKEWREGDFAKGLGAITAYERVLALLPSLPDGWVATPAGATMAMVDAGIAAMRRHRLASDRHIAARMFSVMLSARPTPPTARDTVTLADGSVVDAPASTPPTYVGMHSPTPPTEPPSGWQPIETAPRDGTPVLLTCGERALEPDGDTHCDIGRWGKDFWGEPSWVMNAGGDWPNATYWQPTPAPPEPLETER